MERIAPSLYGNLGSHNKYAERGKSMIRRPLIKIDPCDWFLMNHVFTSNYYGRLPTNYHFGHSGNATGNYFIGLQDKRHINPNFEFIINEISNEHNTLAAEYNKLLEVNGSLNNMLGRKTAECAALEAQIQDHVECLQKAEEKARAIEKQLTQLEVEHLSLSNQTTKVSCGEKPATRVISTTDTSLLFAVRGK